MKVAILCLALAVVVLAQMGEAAPQPRPFDLGKTFLKGVNVVRDAVSDKGNCMLKKGIHKSLVTKAIGCSPMAVAGPEGFMACAGMTSIPEAKAAIQCFTG